MSYSLPASLGNHHDDVGSTSILPTFGAAQAGEPLTMSSLEIAELLGSRHDSAKRTIERLASSGVFDVPPLVEDRVETSHGRKHTVAVYLLDKRSSLIVVAQLSPEFTARVVDRWQELEAQVASVRPVLPDFTNPATAARA